MQKLIKPARKQRLSDQVSAHSDRVLCHKHASQWRVKWARSFNCAILLTTGMSHAQHAPTTAGKAAARGIAPGRLLGVRRGREAGRRARREAGREAGRRARRAVCAEGGRQGGGRSCQPRGAEALGLLVASVRLVLRLSDCCPTLSLCFPIGWTALDGDRRCCFIQWVLFACLFSL